MRLMLGFMIAGAAFPLLAAAQVPPTPPTAPTPPKAVPPKYAVPPRAHEPIEPMYPPFHVEVPRMAVEDMRLQAERMKFDAQELQFHAKELLQLDVLGMKLQAEQMKLAMEDFKFHDLDRMKFQAEEMKFHTMLELPKLLDGFPHGPGMGIGVGMGVGVGVGVGSSGRSGDRLLDAQPRRAWASEDPADSLYRLARESLNRGEYRRAAQFFNEVTKKFPKSVYALDCAYWEAFSRYRVGTTEDLRQALRILDEGRAQWPQLRRDESNVDVQGLRARIQGALAARGDAEAAKSLREEVQGTGCDREEVSVRAEALSALGQMDFTTALPVVKKVLARRDECTTELRRRALYLLGRQSSSESVSIMLDVAKNDTDPNIRGEAMSWLGRVAGDQAVPLLEELLKTSTEERTQRSAVNALSSIDTERARRAVRSIIERTDAVERVRVDAILSLSRERENRSLSAEEMNYLRSLYPKMETPKLKEAVLGSVSRVQTPENEKFLLDIARNQNEPSQFRVVALSRLGRMGTVSVGDIAKLYDVADSRSLRERILHALAERKESEAIDRIIEIAKKDTDPQIRRTAINLLSRSNDERAKKFMTEFFDR